MRTLTGFFLNNVGPIWTKFSDHFMIPFSKNLEIIPEICPKTSVDKSFDSLADKNQTRVKSLIYQKIEQVTLYKTHYTTIHTNSAGPCYCEAKSM